MTCAAGEELHDRAQDVGRAPLHPAHVDRVHPEQDGEHPVARDVVRLVREVIERVADAETLDLDRRLQAHARVLAPLCYASLLDGVGELVRDKLLPLLVLGAELVAAEVDLAPDGEGTRGELAIEGGRAVGGVDAHAAEVGPEARLHEPPHAGRERLAGGVAGLDLRRDVGAHVGEPLGLAPHLGRGRPADRRPGRDGRTRRSRQTVGQGHAHDPLGGGLRLPLRRIGGRRDPQGGLHAARPSPRPTGRALHQRRCGRPRRGGPIHDLALGLPRRLAPSRGRLRGAPLLQEARGGSPPPCLPGRWSSRGGSAP